MVIGSLSGCSAAANDADKTSAQAAEEASRQAEEKAAAKEAEANEYYETGRPYLYGLNGKEINLESAYTNFEKAEELGKVEANFYLGVLYDWYNYPKHDYETALDNYTKALEGTEQLFIASAMNNIGYVYDMGDGVDQDYAAALEWYEKAAALGNETAKEWVEYLRQSIQ